MEQKLFNSNGGTYRLKELNYWRILQIALLLATCYIWFPCLAVKKNSPNKHEMEDGGWRMEDGGVEDDEIDGALNLEELLEMVSRESEEAHISNGKEKIGHRKLSILKIY
ncbi:hypothetical protein REPUB_Repub13aG0168800 [Reevesia pubescens]